MVVALFALFARSFSKTARGRTIAELMSSNIMPSAILPKANGVTAETSRNCQSRAGAGEDGAGLAEQGGAGSCSSGLISLDDVVPREAMVGLGLIVAAEQNDVR